MGCMADDAGAVDWAVAVTIVAVLAVLLLLLKIRLETLRVAWLCHYGRSRLLDCCSCPDEVLACRMLVQRSGSAWENHASLYCHMQGE